MLRQTDNCVVLPHAHWFGGIRPLEVIVFTECFPGETLDLESLREGKDISRAADNHAPTSAQTFWDS